MTLVLKHLLLSFLLVQLVTCSQRYIPCDNPCITNGHVPTCCVNHGFGSGGYCHNGEAYCTHAGMDLIPPPPVVQPRPPNPSPPLVTGKDWSKEISDLFAIINNLKKDNEGHKATENRLKQQIETMSKELAKDRSDTQQSIERIKDLIPKDTVSKHDLQVSMNSMQSSLANEMSKSMTGLQGNVTALDDRVDDIQVMSEKTYGVVKILKDRVKKLSERQADTTASDVAAELKKRMTALESQVSEAATNMEQAEGRINEMRSQRDKDMTAMEKHTDDAVSKLKNSVQTWLRNIEKTVLEMKHELNANEKDKDLVKDMKSMQNDVSNLETSLDQMSQKLMKQNDYLLAMSSSMKDAKTDHDKEMKSLKSENDISRDKIRKLETQLENIQQMMRILKGTLESETRISSSFFRSDSLRSGGLYPLTHA